MSVLPGKIPTGDTLLTAEYKLTGLSPYSNLQIQICIMNNYYVGRPSDPVSFTTEEGGETKMFCQILEIFYVT